MLASVTHPQHTATLQSKAGNQQGSDILSGTLYEVDTVG